MVRIEIEMQNLVTGSKIKCKHKFVLVVARAECNMGFIGIVMMYSGIRHNCANKAHMVTRESPGYNQFVARSRKSTQCC